jgi:hypothetical protein
VTADLYATATGLIERSAAAYAAGVPEGARDNGFFGPASVTWRVNADLASGLPRLSRTTETDSPPSHVSS